MKSGSVFTIGYVLLVFCSLSLWINASQFKGALADSASFHCAQGEITRSRLHQYQRRDRTRPFRFEIVYSPDIRYHYQIGEQNFESSRVDFDLPLSHANPGPAQSTLRKYPLSKNVAVFYLPDDPAFSVLEPEHKGRTPAIFIICVSCWLIGLSLVVSGHLKHISQSLKRKRNMG